MEKKYIIYKIANLEVDGIDTRKTSLMFDSIYDTMEEAEAALKEAFELYNYAHKMTILPIYRKK